MVDASLVLDAIVAVSIAAGAVFAIVEMREFARTRKTQLVIDLMRHASTVEFMDQTDTVWNTDFSSTESWQKSGNVSKYVVAEFYEQVGTLMKLKLIEANLVYEMMGIYGTWDMMRPWILWLRAEYDSPTMYENFESAAENDRAWEAKKRHDKAGP